jgi:carbon-monoxide dehydrogenase medium subunit
MIPAAFEYQKANTVKEAIAALSDSEAKLIAGGYSLIPAMKLRLTRPSKLVDIADIPELKGIEEEDGEIVINAGSTHNEIFHNELIKNNLASFTQAAGSIGDVQVRNRGTIGGSLAHADPAADWPALVLAADATIVITSASGKRNIKATSFFTGLFTTALKSNEMITSIRIPVPANGTKSVYLNFDQPASRFSIVGCAVMRHPEGIINVAFTGASEAPFRETSVEKHLAGKPLTNGNIEQALDLAFNGVDFLGDHYASPEYRKHLAKTYLRKALQAVA